jgi:DNA polymerase III subunit delta
MRLRAEQLQNQLNGTLAPIYVVHGDEVLLIQEACDAIRAAARASGFGDREIFEIDQHFDWQQILNEANSLSLFADKKILELRVPSGKPGRDGSAFFEEYCQNISPDNLLLVVFGKLEKTAMKAKWFGKLESLGVIIQVWPVDVAQMPHWIQKRLQLAGIKANKQAIEVLADRVEGNLLAASQEIEKLKLLLEEDNNIDAETMSTVVADSARYNVFTLIDRILDGDGEAAARTLQGLRNEGAEAIVILWALSRELRILAKAADQIAAGGHTDRVLDNLGVWKKHQPLKRKALQRLRPAQLAISLRQAASIDRAIKGLNAASPWQELTTMVLSLSGNNPIHPQNQMVGLRELSLIR